MLISIYSDFSAQMGFHISPDISIKLLSWIVNFNQIRENIVGMI